MIIDTGLFLASAVTQRPSCSVALRLQAVAFISSARQAHRSTTCCHRHTPYHTRSMPREGKGVRVPTAPCHHNVQSSRVVGRDRHWIFRRQSCGLVWQAWTGTRAFSATTVRGCRSALRATRTARCEPQQRRPPEHRTGRPEHRSGSQGIVPSLRVPQRAARVPESTPRG
jgi:hypothetical protein